MINCRFKINYIGYIGYFNCVIVLFDGFLCVFGGKDGMVMLWDLNEGKYLYIFDGGDILNLLCFSFNRYWFCVVVGFSIKIWVSSILFIFGKK